MIKLAYNKMSAVLVAGHITTQNLSFLPLRWLKPSPVLFAPTHRGMVEGDERIEFNSRHNIWHFGGRAEWA